jgi:hypothetical protein
MQNPAQFRFIESDLDPEAFFILQCGSSAFFLGVFHDVLF